MPKRPSKSWWDRCVSKVEEKGTATDPEAVCGSTWYHRMSSSQKKRILGKEKRK